MTQLSDVTKDFNDGLAKIATFIPNFVSSFQKADSKLRGQKEDLTEGYEVPFAGMGADTFSNAVENNIQVTGQIEQKLQEFSMASDHTNKQIQSANDQYEGQIDNFIPPAASMGSGEGLSYYHYDWSQVNGILRDSTLSYYAMIAGLFDFGLSFLLNNLKDARDSVWNDIVYQSNQNIDGYKQTLNQLNSRLSKDEQQSPANPYQQNYQKQVQEEHMRLSDAKIELDQIYNNEVDAFTHWYNALDNLVHNYQLSTGWDTASGDVTVGDLLQDLAHAPAPIVIYKTADGGIVVLVNTMNDGLSPEQNAALVQKAIEQYEEANGLTNPKVTLLGYKGGADIVQHLAHDNNPFQITQVVLVGGQITMPREGGINYTLYAAPGDNDSGTGGASLDPTNPANQAALGVDGGEIILGGITGGPWGAGIAAGEVVVGTVAPDWAGANSGDVSGAANGGLYFQSNPGPAGQMPGTDNLYAVPNEPGLSSDAWGLSWNFPFVRVKHMDYTQSTFLDTQGIPDPNGDGRKLLQGFEPLSPPTYYNPTS